MLIDQQGAFTVSMVALLRAITAVDAELLERVRVLPRSANWLRFPWYRASRGGAFVLGERIYMLKRSLDGARSGENDELRSSLLLLAHEVGHLPQAQRFGTSAWGRTRFVLWAARQYAWSALLNGMQAHDRAPLEREADEGRWVLRELLAVKVTDPQATSLLEVISANEAQRVLEWTRQHAEVIEQLQEEYRATYRSTRYR